MPESAEKKPADESDPDAKQREELLELFVELDEESRRRVIQFAADLAGHRFTNAAAFRLK